MRDDPCEKCGWKFLGFHVCVDKSIPLDPKIAKKYGLGRKTGPLSFAQEEALAAARNARWERHYAENAERNQKIVDRYKEQVGYRELAAEFGLSYQTVSSIIHRAAKVGDVEIRPRGANLRWRKEAKV